MKNHDLYNAALSARRNGPWPVVLTGDGCYRKCETEVINEAQQVAVAKIQPC